MKANPKLDFLFATASWIIVIALLVSVASLAVNGTTGAGPVAQLIGKEWSTVFYMALYLGEAGFLAYAKLVRNNTLRKRTLLVTYLTGVFSSILNVIFLGFAWRALDNLIITAAAAACWLYWVLRTEYISYEDIQ